MLFDFRLILPHPPPSLLLSATTTITTLTSSTGADSGETTGAAATTGVLAAKADPTLTMLQRLRQLLLPPAALNQQSKLASADGIASSETKVVSV